MIKVGERSSLGKYMYAEAQYWNGKTWVWSIHNRKSEASLGHVKWYTAWRQYCFYPWSSAVFSFDCLEDIAGFLERQNEKHDR